MNRPAVESPLAPALADTETPGVTVSPSKSDDERLEAIYADYVQRRKNGESPDRTEWLQRYPEFAERLERLFGLSDLMADDVASPIDGDSAHPRGYRIESELGQGGMAVVFRAQHLALQRTVAIKVLRGGHWGDRDLQRIRREAEAVARLTHPNIVQIYEIAEWNGQPFLALEFVPGGSLADALAKRDQAVDATVAMTFVETLARAMQSAHDAGIVHRDLKPANILLAGSLDGDPQPKIADFGLAITTDHANEANLSLAIAGTPSYMAPEQADGRRADVGPATDVYGLGAILYELLTGRPPFRGATIGETLDLVRRAEPVRPRSMRPAVSRDLETICLTCLSKEPARRYRSAVALADDLARCLDGRPILARPVGLIESTWKACRRRPLVAGLAGGLAAATATAIILPSVFWFRAEQAAAREVTARKDQERDNARLIISNARLLWMGENADTARSVLADCPLEYRDREWKTLWRDTQPPSAVLATPYREGEIGFAPNSLIFAPDGKTIAVKYGRSDLVVSDTTDGSLKHRTQARMMLHNSAFPEPERLVYSLMTIPTSGAESNRILRYEVKPDGSQPRLRETLQVKPRGSLLMTADGRDLVWVSDQHLVTIRNFSTRTERTLTIPKLIATGFQLDPYGRIVSYVEDEPIRLYDIATLKELRTIARPALPPGQASLAQPVFSADGGRVVFISKLEKPGSTMTLRDCVRGTEITIRDTTDYLKNLAISPDGRWVAAYAGQQKFIGVWDFATGQRRLTLRSHFGVVSSLAFSPESRRLAVGTQLPSVKLWDITDEAE